MYMYVSCGDNSPLIYSTNEIKSTRNFTTLHAKTVFLSPWFLGLQPQEIETWGKYEAFILAIINARKGYVSVVQIGLILLHVCTRCLLMLAATLNHYRSRDWNMRLIHNAYLPTSRGCDARGIACAFSSDEINQSKHEFLLEYSETVKMQIYTINNSLYNFTIVLISYVL